MLRTRILTAVAAALACAVATGSHPDPLPPPPPPPPVTATAVVTPATRSLTVGQSAPLVARALDAQGVEIVGRDCVVVEQRAGRHRVRRRCRRGSGGRNHDRQRMVPDADIDDLTSLAALACNAPLACVIIRDGERHLCTAAYGIALEALPPDSAFWGDAMSHGDVIVVPDTAADPRYAAELADLGGPRIAFFAAAPLLTVDGSSLGALCVCDHVARTLTERQTKALRMVSRQVMARIELRARTLNLVASEERMFRVFGTCPVGLAINRQSDHAFVGVNPAFTALFGWSLGDVVGRTNADLHLVDEAAAAAQKERLLASAEVRDSEMLVHTKDGSARYVLMGGAVVTLMGEPHVISTFIDITDRKRAEALTQASESRYRSLFDYAPDGILNADANGVYTDANASICRMLAYSRAELIGKSGIDIVSDEVRDQVPSALSAIKSSPDYSREWQSPGRTPRNSAPRSSPRRCRMATCSP